MTPSAFWVCPQMFHQGTGGFRMTGYEPLDGARKYYHGHEKKTYFLVTVGLTPIIVSDFPY